MHSSNQLIVEQFRHKHVLVRVQVQHTDLGTNKTRLVYSSCFILNMHLDGMSIWSNYITVYLLKAVVCFMHRCKRVFCSTEVKREVSWLVIHRATAIFNLPDFFAFCKHTVDEARASGASLFHTILHLNIAVVPTARVHRTTLAQGRRPSQLRSYSSRKRFRSLPTTRPLPALIGCSADGLLNDWFMLLPISASQPWLAVCRARFIDATGLKMPPILRRLLKYL